MEVEIVLARLEGKFDTHIARQDAHLVKQDVIIEHLVSQSANHHTMIYGEPPEANGLDKRTTSIDSRVKSLEGAAAAKRKYSRAAAVAALSAMIAWLIDLARGKP